MSSFSFDFHVPADHPCLLGHFPGQPLVPGVLLLDHVIQGLRRHAGRQVARVPRVKFASVLWPQEHARVDCEVDGDRAAFRVTARRGGDSVILAEGVGILSVGSAP